VSTVVLRLEWQLALSDKRAFGRRVLAPMALVLVVASGALPQAAGSIVYVVLFTSLAVFLAAWPLRRDCERGIAHRAVLAGVTPAAYLVQRGAAVAGIGWLQLLPSLILAGGFLGASATEMSVALVALGLALWVAALLGVLIGASSRSLLESLLFSALAVMLLLHMSGVFNESDPGGLGSVLEGASPFRFLYEAVVSMDAGGRASGALASGAWALGLPVVIALLAPRLSTCLRREPSRGEAV